MDNWWNRDFPYRLPLSVVDPLGLGRSNEPVRLDLVFDYFRPTPAGFVVVDDAGREACMQIVRSGRGDDGRLDYASLYFLANIPAGGANARYHVYLGEASAPRPQAAGIQQLKPTLGDGFRRLDTGVYVLELCRGTAQGYGGAKWGLRYFEEKSQGINLIHGCQNAFGGVYGPFFTPENGLVNSPAHQVIEIDPVFEGPVACQYRLHCVIRDGLRPELRNKRLEMIWTFFADTPLFTRTYMLDPYETTIDGRPCRNRMTVGDEIESGKGNLHLSARRCHRLPRRRSLRRNSSVLHPRAAGA